MILSMRYNVIIAVLFTAFFSCAAVIYAAPPAGNEPAPQSMCYSQDTYASEQFIRFQTQLMVIGTMCRDYSKLKGKPDSYLLYQGFADKNKLLIRRYEQRLISMWTDEHKSDPEKELNTLRTNIANGFSQYAMNISPEKFCSMFLTRLNRSVQLSEKYLDKIANRFASDQESTRPLCGTFGVE